MDWSKNRVIALGFFDGVHRGHQALLEYTREYGIMSGLQPTVLSFDTHPEHTVRGETVQLINTPYDRERLIRRVTGIEDVVFLHFDKTLMKMEWDRFILWLYEDFNARCLVAGFDFRFGHNGAGDAEKLSEKCREMGIGCRIIDKVTFDGVKISSSCIRELLQAGEIQEANKFLGHPHTLTDVVRYGYRFGRKMGIPTVNMRIPAGVVVPKRGVYSSIAYLESGESRMAVTNIGIRPTVSADDDDLTVESHLLDYSGDLYGQRVRLELYNYIRPEKKFDGPEELKEQVHQDILATRTFFNK
ncbi:MAG: riboflavin biosynthesis protein RibF [Oscillospiraceae bacterium]|nr:riboflavin biosynthesis protein RibF [Oscillospiraceae bacterium]